MFQYQKIKEIIAEQTDNSVSDVKDDMLIKDVHEMDSLVMSEIIMIVEDEFDVDIPNNANLGPDMLVEEFINNMIDVMK